MFFDPFHNHKWARNLAHARRLAAKGDFETFYRGETLPDGDIYPGMRVMAAYWVSVEHEMKMRLENLLWGACRPEWRDDPALVAQRDVFSLRFQEDMCLLVEQEGICTEVQLNQVICESIETPADWAEKMHAWQEASEASIAKGRALEPELVETWIAACLRSVANYNHYLIWGGVIAAALVKNGGQAALRRAVDATAEDFMWAISREFYANVLPAAGFSDLGDVMELGMRGMYSDQYYQAGEEEQQGETVIKHSLLKNCELAGIFQRVAEWNDLPTLALGYGICRYCEVHGAATMMISIPPMYAPAYQRIQSHGMEGQPCEFELTLTPADDMERLMMVQEKVFGENSLS
jgi:hypothetical protein